MPPENDKQEGQQPKDVEQLSQQSTASTTAPATTESTTSNSTTATTAAPASTEAKDDKPKSALEAALRVMNKDRATEAAAAKPAGTEATATTKTDATTTKPGDGTTTEKTQEATQKTGGDNRLTDAEFKALPEKAQRRFNEIYKEARQYEEKIKSLEPSAQTLGELRSWMSTQGLTQDDFTFGLQVMANVRSNPAKAMEMLAPILADLRKFIGEELPEDLAAEVQAGTVSQARAQELARERNERSRLEHQRRADAEASSQREAAAGVQQLNTQITQAIQGYEDQWKASDPDYGLKWEQTWERMMTLMQKGMPRTKDAAVELLKQARKDVEERMSKLRPAPKPKTEIPTGGANAGTRAAPKSALEAAKAALA